MSFVPSEWSQHFVASIWNTLNILQSYHNPKRLAICPNQLLRSLTSIQLYQIWINTKCTRKCVHILRQILSVQVIFAATDNLVLQNVFWLPQSSGISLRLLIFVPHAQALLNHDYDLKVATPPPKKAMAII